MADPDSPRATMQPALLHAATAFCIYHLTDGFCHPSRADTCKCWNRASAVMEATGLSANAVAWIMQHTDEIEKKANKR